ncbi:hypothetical protein DES40_1915 [Litorimonas taeanensis]|uniref:Lipoprotein n=1 Tax=Litorimonas taeanensis TaxID=568099 RepID=A0A420WDP5_9PROT|nr:hypothetical protein [Litorimonas taeanensis]RKQ69131.1 hypothetical protein DES40_1915 [Litorimonas taeanensis]
MKFLISKLAISTLASIGLIACQADDLDATGPDTAHSETPSHPETPSQIGASAPSTLPSYDFERTLQICVGTICKLGATESMKMSDYSANLISTMGLGQSDTLSDARSKLSEFYGGIVSSSLGGTSDPELKLLSAQLSPGTDKNLPEYDVVIRTKGMSNGARVHDWGARIRCAPVMASTPWQKTPCL